MLSFHYKPNKTTKYKNNKNKNENENEKTLNWYM